MTWKSYHIGFIDEAEGLLRRKSARFTSESLNDCSGDHVFDAVSFQGTDDAF
jgi:hypothetical protein